MVSTSKHIGRIRRERLSKAVERLLTWDKLYNRLNQFVIDAIIVAASLILAFLIRFEGDIPPTEHHKLLVLLPYIVFFRLVMNYLFGVYTLVWRYVSLNDLQVMLKPIVTCSAIFLALRLFLPPEAGLLRLPLSIIAIEFLLVFLGMVGARVVRRILYEHFKAIAHQAKGQPKRVLLVGAGAEGVMAVKEVMRNQDLGLRIVGFVDDDRKKLHAAIAGVKVLGTTADLPLLVHRLRIDEVIITIASASRRDIRRIVEICKSIPVSVKIIPGLYEILGGRIRVSTFREVRIEDLLGRDVVHFDNGTPEVLARFAGKSILITGAGGSIGSELCRQILGLEPRELIMLDKDENSLFEVDLELRSHAACRVTPLIADIRDVAYLRTIFARHRPQVVFHAAAHKHVPLMEMNPTEAILNNVMGTKNLVELADEYGVETFVMLSTDKAVNPVNVMGASKRLAELVVQAKAADSRIRFSCVRFGNVLGSRGSVIPIFQKQIAEGGPLTVTHPEATRYFMTIPEAAHLVIQAGSIGERGEIFVLDMGEQVRILDLAKDLIQLSGLTLGEDIEIEFIGLRPGEKLHEELLLDKEKVRRTKFKKIFVEAPIQIDRGKFLDLLERLERAAHRHDEEGIYALLETWFNGYLRQAGSGERFMRAGR